MLYAIPWGAPRQCAGFVGQWREDSWLRACHIGSRYVGMTVPAALTVCPVRNTPDKFAPCRSPVAEHILDCVVTWQTAVRVLGSAGRTRPPTPAPQLAKEMA